MTNDRSINTLPRSGLVQSRLCDLGASPDPPCPSLLPPGTARVTVTSLLSEPLPAHVLSVRLDAGATARVTLELDAPMPGARDGMSAVVHLTVASRIAVLAVPNHALVGSRGGVRASPVAGAARGKPKQPAGVWTVRGGLMVLAPLTLGVRGDVYSEVLSGLGVGQLVVTGPYALLRSVAVGDPVTSVPAPRLAR